MKIEVKLGGAWRLYTTSRPDGFRMLGSITLDETQTGALGLCRATGQYVMVNDRVIRSVPQDEVAAAVSVARATHGGPGRGQGRKAADGASGLRRTTLSLDKETVAYLYEVGDKCVSLGARRVVARLKGQSQPPIV